MQSWWCWNHSLDGRTTQGPRYCGVQVRLEAETQREPGKSFSSHGARGSPSAQCVIGRHNWHHWQRIPHVRHALRKLDRGTPRRREGQCMRGHVGWRRGQGRLACHVVRGRAVLRVWEPKSLESEEGPEGVALTAQTIIVNSQCRLWLVTDLWCWFWTQQKWS